MFVPCSAGIFQTVKITDQFEDDVSVPLCQFDSRRGLQVDGGLDGGLRVCLHKVDRFCVEVVQLGQNHDDADAGPGDDGGVCVPVVDTELLLAAVATQACFVFLEAAVRMSFSFKRPNHHDLLSRNSLVVCS